MRKIVSSRCQECDIVLQSSWDIHGIECPCGKLLCILCYDTLHFNHREHLDRNVCPWHDHKFPKDDELIVESHYHKSEVVT